MSRKLMLTASLLACSFTHGAALADTPTANSAVPACGSEFGRTLGTRLFSLPSIGVESNAEVGQTMVSTYKTDLMDGTSNYVFSVDQASTLSGRTLGQDFTITLLPSNVRMMPGLWYGAPAYKFKYANDSEPRTGLAKPDVFLSMSLPSREVVAKAKVGFGGEERFVVGTAALITTQPCTVTGPQSFQKELVYSGVAKGIVTIFYKEFIGQLARPAFTQELHFDLSEGNEIGYKGARFKILKASNLGITYLVTKSLE